MGIPPRSRSAGVRVCAFVGALSLLAGCGTDPPPRWAEGGTALVLAPARFEHSGDEVLEVTADGRVLDDGDLVHVIDRVGRVTTEDYEPLALLLPDGRLAGRDDSYLGQIGLRNASPPWRTEAWLSLLPDGRVIFFGDDGERELAGQWRGCEGPQLRTCTLVTHVFLLDVVARRSRSSGWGAGPGFSVGTGIMLVH